MTEIIQKKLAEGHGKIKLKNHGIVDASLYNDKNHPDWDQSTKDQFKATLKLIKIKNLSPDEYRTELNNLNEWLLKNGTPINEDWLEWANDEIIWQPTKNDYELKIKDGKDEGSINPDDYDLKLKDK